MHLQNIPLIVHRFLFSLQNIGQKVQYLKRFGYPLPCRLRISEWRRNLWIYFVGCLLSTLGTKCQDGDLFKCFQIFSSVVPATLLQLVPRPPRKSFLQKLELRYIKFDIKIYIMLSSCTRIHIVLSRKFVMIF